MLIVGDNLQSLADQCQIVDTDRAFDHTSLTLRFGRTVVRVEPPEGEVFTYGSCVPENWITREDVPDSGYIIQPKTCVLASSHETVKMPQGYLGMVQTKGSLARCFLTVHCCDGQVDSGFIGRLTFEICNLGPIPVKLIPRQKIAQLFIYQTSTKNMHAYAGRYQKADGPTVARPES